VIANLKFMFEISMA